MAIGKRRPSDKHWCPEHLPVTPRSETITLPRRPSPWREMGLCERDQADWTRVRRPDDLPPGHPDEPRRTLRTRRCHGAGS
jgi:hypothetical protein